MNSSLRRNVTCTLASDDMVMSLEQSRVPTDQGNQGKTGVFQPKSGKKFQIRELFFQTIFKPFKPINLRKMFFKTVKPQELSENCNICID